MGPLKLVIALLVVGVLTAGAMMLWALHDIPFERAALVSSQPSILLETADAEPFARKGAFRLADAPREKFPDHLINAVLSIEDRRFYQHRGVDFRGTFRALHRNLAAGGIVEGGSTITQQLVKLTLLGDDRTLIRKAREAFVALWLEQHLDKEEILTSYLNAIYMGGGAHGMPAAAQLYFGKNISEVTLSEAALLAGLIRAPSAYSPLANPELAQARAEVVLDSMVDNAVIRPEEGEEAKAKPATLNPTAITPGTSHWFADWVGEEAMALASRSAENLRVRTTMDPEVQRLAEDVLNRILEAEGAEKNVSQGALVAMRPDGAVVAMVGGRDYQDSQFNRAVQSRRQPGSAFKLFVYAAALQNGWRLGDVIEDEPIDMDGWEPANFTNEFAGDVTLAEAFSRSLNAATVHLALEVGIENVIEVAREFGIQSPLIEAPSLALGTSGVSLLELTAAFASVRAGVAPVRPWGIAAFGPDGQGPLRTMGATIGERQSLEPYQDDLVELLQLVVQRGTGRAAALDGFSAGKTGTSQNFRDAWFVGFNEHLVVGVWVGNDDDEPMNEVVGGMLPAQIWKEFMTQAAPLVADDAPLMVALSDADVDAPSRIDVEWPQGDGRLAAHIRRVPAPRHAQCDIEACARAYRSFRESDCTFQPYRGQRRLCTRGSPDAYVEQLELDPETTASIPRTEVRSCNVQACARAYRSFREDDCTFQPYRGPRRLCER